MWTAVSWPGVISTTENAALVLLTTTPKGAPVGSTQRRPRFVIAGCGGVAHSRPLPFVACSLRDTVLIMNPNAKRS